ncbi:MAG TPA: alanine racemase, partial [Arenicellales bacterium]|nr:alanine racemase [Arenicellales bacterium]
RQPIVLLSGFHDVGDLDTIAFRRFSPVVHHQWQIDALAREQLSFVIGVWVKIDTGMHRVGFLASEAEAAIGALENLSDVRIEGLMSHLANADDTSDTTTRRQYQTLREIAAGRPYPLSLANSPGLLGWPATHLDWVRPGMMLYGCSPMKEQTEEDYDLRPVMTLEAQIIATRTIPAGGAVGYGGTWVCSHDTRVGVLMCGYGDGYPRHAPSGTPVWVKGGESRTLGRVSMDLMTIDLSGRDDVEVGDWVELWGKHVPASRVAKHAGTIPYELVTRVTRRVPRVHET